MLETLKNSEQEICQSDTNIQKDVLQNKQVINPYVIGICGGSNCGKSTVSRIIKDNLPDAAILNLIHFYKPIRENIEDYQNSTKNEGKNIFEDIQHKYKTNDFDSPDAIDWPLLIKGVE